MLRMTNPGPTLTKASRGPKPAGKTLTSRVTRSHGDRGQLTSGPPRPRSRGLRGTRSTWTSRTPPTIAGRPRSSPPPRRAATIRTPAASVTTPITRGSSTWARGSRSGPGPVRRQHRRPSPPILVSRRPSRPTPISRSLGAGGAGVATRIRPGQTAATRALSRQTTVRRVQAGQAVDRGTPGVGTPARACLARPGSRPRMTAPPGAAEPAGLVRGTPGARGLTRIPVCPAGLTRDLTPRGSLVLGLPRPGSPIRRRPRPRSLVLHRARPGLLTRDRPRPRSRTRTRRRPTTIPDTDSTRASPGSRIPGLARRGSPSRRTGRRPRPAARGMDGTGAVVMKRSAWLNPLIRDSRRPGPPIRGSDRMVLPIRSSPRPAWPIPGLTGSPPRMRKPAPALAAGGPHQAGAGTGRPDAVAGLRPRYRPGRRRHPRAASSPDSSRAPSSPAWRHWTGPSRPGRLPPGPRAGAPAGRRQAGVRRRPPTPSPAPARPGSGLRPGSAPPARPAGPASGSLTGRSSRSPPSPSWAEPRSCC